MPHPYTKENYWTKKAKKEGYRARSVYKFQEIDEKYHLLHPGMKVLDVGAAPGSWLQYISKKIAYNAEDSAKGDGGFVLGLDTLEIKPVAKNVITCICDIMQSAEVERCIREVRWEKVDLIVSDVMPNTTGIKIVDRQKSIELSNRVFEIAKTYLKPGGYLVMKIFEGEGFAGFLKNLGAYFSGVKIVKPQASRGSSREMYVVCR